MRVTARPRHRADEWFPNAGSKRTSAAHSPSAAPTSTRWNHTAERSTRRTGRPGCRRRRSRLQVGSAGAAERLARRVERATADRQRRRPEGDDHGREEGPRASGGNQAPRGRRSRRRGPARSARPPRARSEEVGLHGAPDAQGRGQLDQRPPAGPCRRAPPGRARHTAMTRPRTRTSARPAPARAPAWRASPLAARRVKAAIRRGSRDARPRG